MMRIKVIMKLCIMILIIILLNSSCAYTEKSSDYSGELIYIKDGNKVYHRDDCKFVKKANNNSIVFLENLEETVWLCLRPCKTCNPPDNKEDIYIVKEKIQTRINELEKKLDELESDARGKPRDPNLPKWYTGSWSEEMGDVINEIRVLRNKFVEINNAY